MARSFRVHFGTEGASEEELRRIEEIEVTQEMDAIWEARIQIALPLDAKGAWQHWPGKRQPFSRVRVEIDAGKGFLPLIDGPLVAIDASLDSQPGRSTATMVVRDDSAFLDRDEEAEDPFERRLASDIAGELFGRFGKVIKETRLDATKMTLESSQRRATVLQFLRELGRANDRHAYVLPGAKPDSSIGCFRSDPTGKPSLPRLVLIGRDRNLTNATVTQDPDGGERTRAQVLRVDGSGVATFETSAADLGVMRDLPALPADLKPRRLLHPSDNSRDDPEPAATAKARRDSYVYKLTSQVIPGCYSAVLTPYEKVRVDAGATPCSGDYLITKVVHRITPSVYLQQLEAKCDSVSEVSGAAMAEALGGGLQLSTSASGIF